MWLEQIACYKYKYTALYKIQLNFNLLLIMYGFLSHSENGWNLN